MKNINFRRFTTSSGKVVLAGKNAEQNEELIKQAESEEIVLHTKQPGSPFVNIKTPENKKNKITKKDIYEAGVFCAKYSQDWRDTKNDVEVHIFKAKNISKSGKMKIGTFGVRKFKSLKIKQQEIKKFEKLSNNLKCLK